VATSLAAGGEVHEDGRLPSGAAWRIEIPAAWNGTLLLYSHGYGGGPSYPLRTALTPAIGKELLARGYALAASSFAQDGWAVESALSDQIAFLDLFAARHGEPKRTIAWGESMGGLVTAGLAQTRAGKLAGAVCLCGSVGGVVGMLNLSLDGAFAIRTLLAPDSAMQLVNLTDERANNTLVREIVDEAQTTPQGRARLALAAALGQVATWGRVGPEPKPGDYAAEQANQYRALMTGLFAPRQPLEQRAGGNFSWNTGIDYRRQVERSGRRPALLALYREAGLDLDKDLEALNRAPRVAADPKAVAYMKRNIIPSGEIGVPVLTVSSPGDEMTFFAHEQAMAAAVRAAGRSHLLRQTFVNRPGHCVFSVSELVAAIQTVEKRAETGQWEDTSAAAMNRRASALGLDAPQFVAAAPPEFLRPCTSRESYCEGEPVAPAGSGPHKAVFEGDAGQPGHTVFRPADLSAFGPANPMPVVAWANGGCANSPRGFLPFLVELASHGFLVAAIGPPGLGGDAAQGRQTRSAQLLEALDWATAENRRPQSKYYGKLDPSKFAVMGQSCGGLQALEVSPDPRVTTSVIMNSGVLNTTQGAPPMPVNVGKDILKRLHAPVAYIIGGEKDIAFPNASDDFQRIDTVPVAMANLDVGHGGTYREPDGGEFGRVAVAWLKWRLQGDQAAGRLWSGSACGLCTDARWKLEKKKLP
jgi:dienelactone hydrolase